jgi:hypothetical protein
MMAARHNTLKFVAGPKSAINKIRRTRGPVWGKQSFDRLIRSEEDLQEKFRYICRNLWDTGAAGNVEDYRWLWTLGLSSAPSPKTAREARALPGTTGAILVERAAHLVKESHA